MLGAILAAGFYGLMGNPPKRKKRRKNPRSASFMGLTYTLTFQHGQVTGPHYVAVIKQAGEHVYDLGTKATSRAAAHKEVKRWIKARYSFAKNPKRRRRNPSTEARELALFITNDGDLYRQQAQPIIKNLRKKIAKGTYDAAKALKLWGYLANSGAQKYTKEYGTPGPNGSYGSFSAADRRETAKELADSYEEELHSTNPRRRRKKRRARRR